MYMYVYVYMFIYRYMYMYVNTYIYIYIYIHTPAYIVHICYCVYARVNACIFMRNGKGSRVVCRREE